MRSAATPFEKRSALERALTFRHVNWLRVDWHVLLVALALLAFGLFFVHHMDLADRELGRDQNEIDFGVHLQKVLLTLPALLAGLLIRPRWLRRNAWAVYVASLWLLLLVPVFGSERNNAKRWIQLPIGFDLQPSELAKLGLIVALARVLYTCRLTRWSDWTRPAVVTLIPMALVALQPDLGTAMTIVPVAVGMFYAAGAPAKRIFGIVATVLVVFVLAYQFELIRDYQIERVRTWLSSMSPEHLKEGKTGAAFHTYHARVAIGNGGWFGRGLGRGVANEAGHLPERESDSIFAVIAEEAGFFGTAGLLLLYALLIVLILSSASSIRERFSRLVVCGIGLYFAAHFFVNVGVNMGLIPMTGLTLPLFSTGGSSMLVTFGALGLALGLAAQREATLDEDAFRA
ncbi:MAG: rod shape-determining protein RodA [Planctomycetes bacterium]|nr:rod shape-determining protein RodA [Planctomycetota bacterium]